jgi:sec-independent protein translocase protein TatB
MFDIASSELLLVAIVALVVIGPKDLPRLMRVVGHWVGKAKGVARQFRSGFDEMVREAELREMEEKWRAENERIMRDHPAMPAPAEAEKTDAAEPPADAEQPLLPKGTHS